MAGSRRWTLLAGVAILAALSAGSQATGQQSLSRQGYENIKTLKDAIEVVKNN